MNALDGGIQDAIDRANQAIIILKSEQHRRQDLMHVGGIPSAPRTRLPINKLVTACVTGKRGR